MSQNINERVEFRLRKSDGTLQEAKVLAEKALWNGVVNRLYYAAFYAVSAWLYQNNINAKTHSGTRIKFNELLIKTKVLPEKYADIYSDLFSNRQDGDYEDFMIFTEKETEPFIEETQNLIGEIKKLITDGIINN